jgi:hypothetical protein
MNIGQRITSSSDVMLAETCDEMFFQEYLYTI